MAFNILSKLFLFRKDLSHWSKHDVPSLKLSSQLDTDHWAKLKGKVRISQQFLSKPHISEYAETTHENYNWSLIPYNPVPLKKSFKIVI